MEELPEEVVETGAITTFKGQGYLGQVQEYGSNVEKWDQLR